jgi:uncharacterized OsmC-like protein
VKITLVADNAIRLEPTHGQLTVEAESAETEYSPFHMLASGLATCTFSVMLSWAKQAKLSVDDLVLDVTWEFANDPHRVSVMTVEFDWPSLPASRVSAAQRVAKLCAVHATFEQPPAIEFRPARPAANTVREHASTGKTRAQ